MKDTRRTRSTDFTKRPVKISLQNRKLRKLAQVCTLGRVHLSPRAQFFSCTDLLAGKDPPGKWRICMWNVFTEKSGKG